jgi:hypothetical protein
MGLLVDKPKPGSGTTNDGNSRRFFKPHHQSASKTGINEDLILNFCVILETVTTGYKINLEAFELDTTETRRVCMNSCLWFCMPDIVHKLLVHSPDIIESCILSIRLLSEEG